MASFLYLGQVRHRRKRPKLNAFTYPLFMPLIDLDEIEQLSSSVRFFSLNRFNWAQLKRSDYLADMPQFCLKEAAIAKLKELTGYECHGKVQMLGQLRYLGIYFSPINCFYCYNPDGELDYLLAEVSNTPWLEKHYYAVPAKEMPQMQQKVFHVSPFMGLDMAYLWRFKAPANRLLLHLENHDSQGLLFDATLTMIQKPLNSRTLIKTLLRIPAMTLSVVLRIYWQALKIWLKGIPYVPYPKSGVKHGQ